jgi:uncharacterized protein YndB with AHSA1/START domain
MLTNKIQKEIDFIIKKIVMKDEPVIVERTLNAPVEIVWKAITNNEQMKQWYFQLKEFKPEVGFEFHFSGGPDKEHQYLHICKITEVVLNKKITYSWRFDGYKGISYVTFELLEEGDKTRLKLTHFGLETFPQDIPDFQRRNFEIGWIHIIGKSLKEFVEKLQLRTL